MKTLLIALFALGSITAFAFEVECNNGKYILPLRGDSSYDKYFTTVLSENGENSINITNNIVLNVDARENVSGEVEISLAAGRIEYGWKPYVAVKGINYIQLNLNKNSLSLPVYESDNEILNGSKNKREEAFQKFLAEKEAIQKEFMEKHGELVSFTCRVKR